MLKRHDRQAFSRGKERAALRIALFDYKVIATNPAGGCHLRILQALCHEHEFDVFALEFENPCPERIRWVRIPAPGRPLALLFVVYHLLAPLYYWLYRRRWRVRHDLTQAVESNLSFGSISYSHFCHRAYLDRYWKLSPAKGFRGWLRRLDHWLHARMEPFAYRRARSIVVPSHGLARELVDMYPWARDKIQIVPNPVDLERMRRPENFDREAVRRRTGIGPDDVLLVFVALGHFERKGLPLLLQALAQLREPRLKLAVVGGEAGLVSGYRSRAARMGLGNRVLFAGKQSDLRPYLWIADAFTLPSLYEAFPLVALEAAAAGLPLIVTPVNGMEEFLHDGINGIIASPRPDDLARGLARFLAMSREEQQSMGAQAMRDVRRYATEDFVHAWRSFYSANRRRSSCAPS